MKQRCDTAQVALGSGAMLFGIVPALCNAFGVAPFAAVDGGPTAISGWVTACLAFGGLALAAAACERPAVRLLGSALAMTTSLMGALAWSVVLGGSEMAAVQSLMVRFEGSGALPPSAAAATCFTFFAAAMIGLPFVSGRSEALIRASIALLLGTLGAAALVGYLLQIDLLHVWPGTTAVRATAATGLVLAAAGLWRNARRTTRDTLRDEAQPIKLTAVVVLSLVAVVTGLATFAAADHEYDLLAKEQLDRSARGKRAFVQYALDRHVSEVQLASERIELERDLVLLDRQPDNARARKTLADAAATLVRTGFAGWRYETLSGETVSAGRFIEQPELRLPLIGPLRTELIWHNGYFLRTRVPLTESGQVQGYAVAEKALRELDQITLEVGTWGDTGEIGLCGGVDQDIACIPLRSNPIASRDVYPTVHPTDGRISPMALALGGESGLARTTDSRQHEVFAAYGPVGTTGLGMVVKIDTVELHAALARSFGKAVALMLLLVAAGVAVMQHRLRPLTHALVQARIDASRNAERFLGAAASSLDAYFLLEPVRDAQAASMTFASSI